MESEHDAWEEETLELLRDSQLEFTRLESRLAQVQREHADCQRRLESIQAALDIYRAKHGRSSFPTGEIDQELAAEYQDLAPKQMVQRWAETHNGAVVMVEMTGTLARAGLFTDKRTADGVLYPVVRRGPSYEKVRRGVYRKLAPVRMIASGLRAS